MDAAGASDVPRPAETLTGGEVTFADGSPTVLHMPATWPRDEFIAYLRALMMAAGIRDWADLSRRTGVRQTQFTNWQQGAAQPSRDTLKRIAPALGVKPIALYIQAGRDEPGDLDLTDSPDLSVYPGWFRDLLTLYDEATEANRAFMESSALMLAREMRERARDSGRPPGWRRVG